ncbi:hypothetical protein ACFBZI_11790 [Moraxella sp. ZJ142]|uniref:hypothetical protein n=1 Tax=Moraxella marmotae TaxID=3344520 RepID=UPI0035D440B0
MLEEITAIWHRKQLLVPTVTDEIIKINEQIAHKKKLLDVMCFVSCSRAEKIGNRSGAYLLGGLFIFFFSLVAAGELEKAWPNPPKEFILVWLGFVILVFGFGWWLSDRCEKAMKRSPLPDKVVLPLLDIAPQYSDHPLIKKLKTEQISYNELRSAIDSIESEIDALEYDLIALKKQAIGE